MYGIRTQSAISGRAPKLAPLIVLVSEWTLNESDLSVDAGVVCGVGSSSLLRQLLRRGFTIQRLGCECSAMRISFTPIVLATHK